MTHVIAKYDFAIGFEIRWPRRRYCITPVNDNWAKAIMQKKKTRASEKRENKNTDENALTVGTKTMVSTIIQGRVVF